MGSIVSICKDSNSDVLVAPPIILSQQVPQVVVHQDSGKNNISLHNSVEKETEAQHSPEELGHKLDDESVLSAQKTSTRPHIRKSVGSGSHRLEKTKNFSDKEITINLKILGKLTVIFVSKYFKFFSKEKFSLIDLINYHRV